MLHLDTDAPRSPDRPGPLPCHLSIVSTLYRSRPFLPEFVDSCLAMLAAIGCRDFELVFVDDGSPDDSAAWLLERKKAVPQIVVVRLSRNFGHHVAMLAGLAQARGEYVALIDCDLEVSPLELGGMYERLRVAPSCDAVYGYQDQERKGGWVERVGGGLFWRLFNACSPTKVPADQLAERVMTRRYVDSLLRLGDRSVFLAGMLSWVGYEQIGVPVKKGLRAGASTYTLAKRFRLLVEAITSFSDLPLRFLFHAGLFITLASSGYGTFLVLRKLVHPHSTLLGYTSLSALILFSLGLIMMSLGTIGIYLSRIFAASQRRPLYVIRDIHA